MHCAQPFPQYQLQSAEYAMILTSSVRPSVCLSVCLSVWLWHIVTRQCTAVVAFWRRKSNTIQSLILMLFDLICNKKCIQSIASMRSLWSIEVRLSKMMITNSLISELLLLKFVRNYTINCIRLTALHTC